jgi:hypothetical protein
MMHVPGMKFAHIYIEEVKSMKQKRTEVRMVEEDPGLDQKWWWV